MGFRAYDPLEDDESLQREAVIDGDGEYVAGAAHVNAGESHRHMATRGSRYRGVSKDELAPYLRAFRLRRRILPNPGRDALKEIVRTVL